MNHNRYIKSSYLLIWLNNRITQYNIIIYENYRINNIVDLRQLLFYRINA